MIFHKTSNNEYWVESERETLVTYDLRLEEYGWTCNCPQNIYRHSCKHVDSLLLKLNGPTPILAPKRRVRSEDTIQAGMDVPKLRLEDLFDYSSAPAPKVTNRAQVRQFPSGAISLSHASPSRDRETYDALPVVCCNCGCDNDPGAQVCRVCSHRPGEAYLVHTG